jgi:hypothetical protein
MNVTVEDWFLSQQFTHGCGELLNGSEEHPYTRSKEQKYTSLAV